MSPICPRLGSDNAMASKTHSSNLRQILFRAALASGLVFAVSVQPGCGTIIHPERKGQTGGQLDVGIVLLNGIGLLFFVIPGIIAYAVDFSTGAIYLPADEVSDAGDSIASPTDRYVVVRVNPEEMTPELVERVIREHAGVDVSLSEDEVQRIQGEGEPSDAEIMAQLTRLNQRDRPAGRMAWVNP